MALPGALTMPAGFPRIFDLPGDREALERRLARFAQDDPKIVRAVERIIEQVRRRGIEAALDCMERFDGVRLDKQMLRIPEARLRSAWERQPAALRRALTIAKNRIEAYHRKQREEGFTLRDASGAVLTHRVMPLQSVGIYIPGGLAGYPSTVLMTVIPARVAGVKRVVGVTPPIQGREENETILAAAWVAGLREIYQIGGAQAVATLAFGADPIPRVDKVVGPGGVWPQMAKRLLYGTIDIDMIAGPTEVVVVADRTAAPSLVAADMLAQAEHDPSASAWAVVVGEYDVAALRREIMRQTQAAPRRAIIEASLKATGAIIRARSREEAVELVNWRAPEHVEIITQRPQPLADRIHSAGAIFLGPFTPEPIGDYVAGSNHVLPTGRTARFFSGLSVRDFVRTDHVIELSEKGLRTLGPAAVALAEAEGLFAHAAAVRERIGG